MNRVILIGNMGNDISLKYVKDDLLVGKFTLATTDTVKKEKVTQWHNITVFGKQAEIIDQYTSKGSKLMVEGRINYESWETDDGEKKYKTVIMLERFEFLSNKNSDSLHNESPKRTQKSTDDNVDSDDLPF